MMYDNKKGQYACMSVILGAKFMSCFSASGGSPPDLHRGSATEAWTPLGDFRPPDRLNFVLPNLLTPGDATVLENHWTDTGSQFHLWWWMVRHCWKLVCWMTSF